MNGLFVNGRLLAILDNTVICLSRKSPDSLQKQETDSLAAGGEFDHFMKIYHILKMKDDSAMTRE